MNNLCPQVEAPKPALVELVQHIESELENEYKNLISINSSVDRMASVPTDNSDKCGTNPPTDLISALDRLRHLATRNRYAADEIKERLERLV